MPALLLGVPAGFTLSPTTFASQCLPNKILNNSEIPKVGFGNLGLIKTRIKSGVNF